MKTLRLQVRSHNLADSHSQESLQRAAMILREGGTVALPTETVYGLGANALDPEAVAKIFAAKDRPDWDPLIVHICDEAMLLQVTGQISAAARRLMSAFWPGPLTLLLPRSSAIPDAVTAGRPLVGVRMPAHPVALELIRRAGVPVAAPSANRFGHTSPTTADHVLEDLDGRIDAVLDAGPAELGLESTVLDPNAQPVLIYRPGAISVEQVRAVAGSGELFVPAPSTFKAKIVREGLPSPGVGMRHYAPKAHMLLLEIEDDAVLGETLGERVEGHSAEAVGVMLPSGLVPQAGEEWLRSRAKVFEWGNWNQPEELAHCLYAGLRQLDAEGCSLILCPVPRGFGIAEAIRDRLRKAARPA